MASYVVNTNIDNKQEQEKDRWCKLAYANLVNNWLISNNINPKKILGKVPQCRFKCNCYYAHKREEITLLKYLKEFNDFNKAELDIYKHYSIMKSLIIKNKSKLSTIQKKIINESDLNDFITVLRIWRNFNCEFSKQSKSWKPRSSSKFKFRHEIPSFEYENCDMMWAIYKYTKKCEQFIEMKSKISTKSKIVIDELCRRDKNCKNGCHEIDEMICIDDMIKGQCNCKYKTKDIIKEKIKNLKKDSEESKNLVEDMYKVKKHLTLEGLIPFEIQRNNHVSQGKKTLKNTLNSEELEKKMKEGLSIKDRIKNNKKRLAFLSKD